MFDLSQAEARALKKAQEVFSSADGSMPLVILAEQTVTHGAGWLFFYNTKAFLETGDFDKMLMGNAPIFVNKKTGKASFTLGSLEPEEAIEYLLKREGEQ